MKDISFLKLGLNKAEETERANKNQKSANDVELAQVGLFEETSETDTDVEKIADDLSKYQEEDDSSFKTFIDGLKEKYRNYKIKRDKEKKEELIEDIAEKKEYIRAKKAEKTTVSDRTHDELLIKQENIDIAFEEYHNQLKNVDKELAKDLEKVKKTVDYKNVNLQDVSEELQNKMKDIDAEVLQKYPELQVYVDEYNSRQNEYSKLKEDLLDDCTDEIDKARRKVERYNKRLDRMNGKEEDEKAVGTSKKSDETKVDSSQVKITDVDLSKKAQVQETLSKANELLEKALDYTKSIVSGKQEDIASKQNEFDAIYKELYSELRNCDTELASDLYAVKYKIDIKENQIEKIDGQIMQLKEDLYNGQNVNIVKNNTLAVYEEMLADLNKFDESQLSENKKNELKTKKEELKIVIENYKKQETNAEDFDADEIALKIHKLENHRKTLSSDVETLKGDMGEIQTKIKTEHTDLSGKVDKFSSSCEDLSKIKTEKMEELKTKHMKVLNSKLSAEVELGNINAVEVAKQYQFFDTELPDNFAKKLDDKLGYGFSDKLSKICKKYGISEKDLVGLMFSESGLNPQSQNKDSDATGLIQFMPETAEKQLHTTISALYNMSAVQQLDYVDKYFSSWLKEGGNYDAGELYTAVYMPARVGREVVAERGGSGYSGNSGLDLNSDGKTTKYELAQKVRNKYQDALKAFGC